MNAYFAEQLSWLLVDKTKESAQIIKLIKNGNKILYILRLWKLIILLPVQFIFLPENEETNEYYKNNHQSTADDVKHWIRRKCKFTQISILIVWYHIRSGFFAFRWVAEEKVSNIIRNEQNWKAKVLFILSYQSTLSE